MEEYNIEKKYAVITTTDSKGTQIKYHKDNYWYKIDNLGKEGLAETLVSDILSCSNVKFYVQYEQCIINGKHGCRSKNFLKEGETFVTFQKIYQNYVGGKLAEKIASYTEVKDRFEYLLDFIYSSTSVDCKRYLQDNLALDYLIKNPDRHYHNLGLIYNSDNDIYKPAPIFDNGQGLFQNYIITPPYMTVEEKEEAIYAATISGSFDLQMITAENHLKIDYSKAEKVLKKYPDSMAKEYLIQQLNKNKSIFQDKTIEQER